MPFPRRGLFWSCLFFLNTWFNLPPPELSLIPQSWSPGPGDCLSSLSRPRLLLPLWAPGLGWPSCPPSSPPHGPAPENGQVHGFPLGHLGALRLLPSLPGSHTSLAFMNKLPAKARRREACIPELARLRKPEFLASRRRWQVV